MLPSLVVPPGKQLAGRVSAEVRVRGRLPRPDLDVKASLQNGRVDRVRDLAFTLTAAHRRGRATGELRAQALGTSTGRGSFARAVAARPGAPLKVELAVGEVDRSGRWRCRTTPCARGGRAGGADPGGEGTGGQSRSGAERPDLRLAGDREALGDVVLRVRDPRGQPLAVRLNARVFGQHSELDLDSPVVIGRWVRQPPTPDELMAVPFALRASMRRLSLAAVTARPGRQPPSLAG